MAVVTTKPIATAQTGDFILVGTAATFHAALSDVDDTTYVYAPDAESADDDHEFAKLVVADTAVPAFARIRAVRARYRVKKNDTEGWYRVHIAVTNSSQPSHNTGMIRTKRSGFTTLETGWYTTRPGGGAWIAADATDLRVMLSKSFRARTEYALCELDVDYNEAPTLTPTGPSGTLADLSQPTVTWQTSDVEGDPIEAFELRVIAHSVYTGGGFNAADPGPATWTFGPSLENTLSKQVAVPLTAGTYRAYGRARQPWPGSGDHWGPWSFGTAEFTIDSVATITPSLSATAEASLGRVKLVVTAGAGSPAADTFVVEFSDDAGATWGQRIRETADPKPHVGGLLTVHDYESPLNEARHYRAVGYRLVGASQVPSVPSASVQATVTGNVWRLKDPRAPELNMTLPVRDHPTDRRESQGVFYPLGRDKGVVVRGDVYGQDATLDLVFHQGRGDAQAEFAKLEALRGSGRTLLLQAPYGGEQWYIAPGEKLPSRYLYIDDPAVPGGTVKARFCELSYVETSRPS